MHGCLRPAASKSLSASPLSDPFGTTHSSSKSAKRPRGLPSTSSRHAALSMPEKSSAVAGSPSRANSSFAASSITALKMPCSFSLAKLMQSCSSELTSKISKPKMSSTPT